MSIYIIYTIAVYVYLLDRPFRQKASEKVEKLAASPGDGPGSTLWVFQLVQES